MDESACKSRNTWIGPQALTFGRNNWFTPQQLDFMLESIELNASFVQLITEALT